MINLEVISRELLGLVDLTKAQTLHIYESAEVIIVSKDENLVFAAFYIVALSVEGFNYGQRLLIVDFVPNLNRDHLSRKKGY